MSQKLADALANDKADQDAIKLANDKAAAAKVVSDQAELDLVTAQSALEAVQVQLEEVKAKVANAAEVEAGLGDIAKALGLTESEPVVEVGEPTVESPAE